MVRKQHRAGYQAIKTYSNLNQQAFDALIEEANALNMPVTGHSPEGERTQGIPYQQPFTIPWQHSLGRGFTTLEHIETIVWHGLRDQLDPQLMQALAAQITLSGEAVTPTLYAHRRLVLIAQTQGEYLQRDGVDMINPLTTWFSQDAQQYWSQLDPTHYELPHSEFFLVATGLLHQAGVPLLTGTDSGSFGIIPGASVIRELELLVQAGLSPYQAIQSATQVNADVIGFTDSGRVLPGYRANLILVPSDPLNDISALEFPAGVMINGVWLDEQALDELKASARGSNTMTFLRSLIRVIEMKLFT